MPPSPAWAAWKPRGGRSASSGARHHRTRGRSGRFITILLIPVQVIARWRSRRVSGRRGDPHGSRSAARARFGMSGFNEGYRARVSGVRGSSRPSGTVVRSHESRPRSGDRAHRVALGVWAGGRAGRLRSGIPRRACRNCGRTRATTGTATSSLRNSRSASDVLTVIVESQETESVSSHDLMAAVDRFAWHMQTSSGVQDVVTLPFVAKIAIAAGTEGSLKWRSIPRSGRSSRNRRATSKRARGC